ncbi:alginate lyase family protein [Aureibaculum conchae]|uniref:alginate lyase family protein n=1 Tax=Aureibaculum sp. 2308TA14-22 TaxID=3108392 RepID=UPI003390F2B8
MKYSYIKLILISFISLFFINSCNDQLSNFDLVTIEKERVLELADTYFNVKPITVANFACERSAGSINDFYSEGDYWWPDPGNPNGPYIRKDGLTNPENFTEHRKAMIRLSQISGSLASAYVITKDEKYVNQLIPHLKAWFIDEATKMNPNLLFGQAIMGKVTGRGIGIIDTIHLMEVALAIKAIQDSAAISKENSAQLKSWFSEYLIWLTTHEFGIKEKNNGNNHSVCWATQVAVFADVTDNDEILEECRTFYKNNLLPNQMDKKGAFPLELARTKPYWVFFI